MRKSRSNGVTLVELLVVVSILGIVALVAIPDFSSSNPQTLDLAAEDFANAMRFARSEALRTGEPHGFKQPMNTKRIKVFRPDTGTSPWTVNFDVYHPISKKLYSIRMIDHPFADADSVDLDITHRATCNKPNTIHFDNNGIPRCTDPETVLLEQFNVTLTLGTHTRVVTLHGITGRVTIQ